MFNKMPLDWNTKTNVLDLENEFLLKRNNRRTVTDPKQDYRISYIRWYLNAMQRSKFIETTN